MKPCKNYAMFAVDRETNDGRFVERDRRAPNLVVQTCSMVGHGLTRGCNPAPRLGKPCVVDRGKTCQGARECKVAIGVS